MPNLTAGDRTEARYREPLVPEHENGPYRGESETLEKYQNVGNSEHMLKGLTRVSSGGAETIGWQLNLRNGLHQKPDDKWRRYFTRSQVSFDMMKENCASDNEQYQKSHITPHDRRPDRRSGAICTSTMRDDTVGWRRWEGCEGTNVGQWRHLIEHRKHGHKGRRQLQHETTLREDKKDPNGARICDTRSEGCITEMLGKKKWVGHVSHEPLAARPPKGDPKMHHMSRLRILPEVDEDNRRIRMSKHPRTDANIPDSHQPPAALDQGR